MRCMEAVDKSREAGRPTKELAQPCTNLSQGKSSEQTAKVMGVSARKVEQARTIRDENPEAWEEVKQGKKTTNRAYRETKEKRQPATLTEPVTTTRPFYPQFLGWVGNRVGNKKEG